MTRTNRSLDALFQRELEAFQRRKSECYHRLRRYDGLDTLWTSSRYSCEFCSDHNLSAPIFAVEFSRFAGNGKFAAACDEEGYVTLIDMRESSRFGTDVEGWCNADFRFMNPQDGQQRSASNFYGVNGPICSVMVHENAVFDVSWLGVQDQWIATASGDQKARILDLNTLTVINELVGHNGSVKAVKEKPGTDGRVIATASRDGNVMIWDSRCQAYANGETGVSCLRPIMSLRNIHESRNYSSPQMINAAINKWKRTTVSRRRAATKSNISHGVTSLAFLPFDGSNSVFTSGAVDGAVKLWDLRKTTSSQFPNPVSTIFPGRESGMNDRPHGISSIDIDSKGEILSVSSTDSNVYLYRADLLDRGSFSILAGHRASSFYIKACFSPDSRFIMSGSADSSAYIWDISSETKMIGNIVLPSLRLRAHVNEVSDVAWCKTDPQLIATVGDDCRLQLWQARNRKLCRGDENDLYNWKRYEKQYTQAELYEKNRRNKMLAFRTKRDWKAPSCGASEDAVEKRRKTLFSYFERNATTTIINED
eukprot:jgi/Galph1/1081/GphlegSOOS_G5897.1